MPAALLSSLLREITDFPKVPRVAVADAAALEVKGREFNLVNLEKERKWYDRHVQETFFSSHSTPFYSFLESRGKKLLIFFNQRLHFNPSYAVLLFGGIWVTSSLTITTTGASLSSSEENFSASSHDYELSDFLHFVPTAKTGPFKKSSN